MLRSHGRQDETGAIIHVESAFGAPTPDGLLYVILGGYVDQPSEQDSKRAELIFRKFSPDSKELRTDYYAMPSGEGFTHGQFAVYDAVIAGDQLVFLAESYIGAVSLPSP